MHDILQNFRYATRALVKSPGYTFLVVMTLAVGIGANAAIFSIIDGAVLSPLPFPSSERLVRLCAIHESVAGFCVASPPDVEDWSGETRTLESLGVGRGWPLSLQTETGLEGIPGGLASAGFLAAFHARAAVGRTFAAEDFEAGQRQVAMLSHGLWRRQFGGDQDIVGSAITLEGESHTVVGVLPADFEIPELEQVEVWLPLPFDPGDERNRGWRGFQAIARLRPDATLSAARRELAMLAERLAQQYPDTNEGWGATVERLHSLVVGPIRSTLWMFWGAVTLVLLIACANVANMLLARSLARQRELAIRTALGASRKRLVVQLLTESLVLSLAAGAIGLALAWWAVSAFLALAPADIPRLEEVHVDATVLGFTVLISILATFAFGLLPAQRASRFELTRTLAASASTSGGHASSSARSMLVISEVALTLVLLIGAGLLIRSFAVATSWEGGFEHENLLTLWLLVPQSNYPEKAQVVDVYRRAVEEIRSLPSVTSVGAASAGPLFGGRETAEVFLPDRPSEPLVARWFDVGIEYFQTLELPLVAGRHFTGDDRAGAPRVAVVNETMARRLAPDGDAVGRSVEVGEETLEIVGVVGDVQPLAPGGVTDPEIYWPNLQAPRWATYLVVRTASESSQPIPAIRDRLRAIDANLSVRKLTTFDQLIADRLVVPRFHMSLLSVFAFVALVLAAGGIYGVLAHNVSSRLPELGLRMSLGADRRNIFGFVVRQGLGLVGLGVVLGLVGALALTRFLSSMLFGITSTHPATFLTMAVLLLATSLAASFLPARRASRVDPMTVIRSV